MNTVIHIDVYYIHFQIFKYIREREGFIQSFLNHLGTSAIMDLLIQMVAAPDNDQSRVDLAWVCRCICCEGIMA